MFGELRITRVFPCVARGFEARASFMFAGCCWWRSLAVDGGSGASRGTPAMRRPGPHPAVVLVRRPSPQSDFGQGVLLASLRACPDASRSLVCGHARRP